MEVIDYLSDLERWQASSHPELASRRPEELFRAPFPKTYRRLHQDLRWRIIRLHGTFRTLEQLNQFPFEYIYPPARMEFWRLVITNFVETAMLKLHGLVEDFGERRA